MLDWHPDLPQIPIRDGFQVENEDTRIVFKTGSHAPKMRPDPGGEDDLYDITLNLNYEQARLIRRWRKLDLANGTLPFRFYDVTDEQVHIFSFESTLRVQEMSYNIWHAAFRLRRHDTLVP